MLDNNKIYTAEEVYKSILKRIIKLELEPGQLISENQMCIDYGVSRSIIRSAFTTTKRHLRYTDRLKLYIRFTNA